MEEMESDLERKFMNERVPLLNLVNYLGTPLPAASSPELSRANP